MGRTKEYKQAEAAAIARAKKAEIARGKEMLRRADKAFKGAKTEVGIKRALRLKYEALAIIRHA